MNAHEPDAQVLIMRDFRLPSEGGPRGHKCWNASIHPWDRFAIRGHISSETVRMRNVPTDGKAIPRMNTRFLEQNSMDSYVGGSATG
jgi:hypothetical protein